MKYFLFAFIFLTMINFIAGQEIYESKKDVVYRSYLTKIADDVLMVEIGGTSLKIGGKYIVFYKNEDSNGFMKFSSPNNKSYVIFKKNRYKLYHFLNDKFFKYKFREVSYSEKIDRIRFNIFRRADYNEKEEWVDVKILKEKFEKFKESPLIYLEEN